MEGHLMKRQKEIYPDLDFETEESTIKSFEVIQKEFFKKTIKTFLYILIVLVVFIVYFIIRINPELVENTFLGSINPTYYSKLTIAWSIFSTTTFLFIYLLKIIYLKYTPSLIRFIRNESKNLGFSFNKKFDSGLIFLLLNSVSVCILIYIDLGMIKFGDGSVGRFYTFIIGLYLFASLIVPISWIFFDDRFIIQLKDDYYILFDFHFKIGKPKEDESNLVGIHLTSNRLSPKNDRCGRIVYSKIAKRRWLSKKKISKLNPYLHFYEFSTPLNFQKQFLNIALALTEWQIYYGSRIFCFDPRIPLNKIDFKERFLDYNKFFANYK